MSSRIRRHMLLSGGILLGAIPLELGGRLLSNALGLGSPWSGVVFAIPIVLVPIVGITSAIKNLRCPSCEKMVVRQVSAHYAVLGPLPGRACLHCRSEIFRDPLATRRRMRYMVVGVMAVSFVLALIVSLADSHHR